MVMATKTPQGARLNPQNTLELSQGMSLQVAIDTANAHGGEWTILLYPGAPYREGDITHVGVANITIKSMGPERAVIAPTVIPAAGVIISGAILTLDGVDVMAPNNVEPALRVEGGTCHCIGQSEFACVGAGNAIEQVAGILTLRNCQVPDDIDLSTANCDLAIYHSDIRGDINASGALLAHAIWVESCYLHNHDIQVTATGASTCSVANSTYLDQITNAGTGDFYINGTSVSRINQTGAGTTTVYGGYVWQITRAVGSVIWWPDDTTLKVIPSQTAADTVIQWAVNAADAATGPISILVHAGTYTEGEITPGGGADITIQSQGEGETIIASAVAPASGVIVSEHTLTLVGLTITAPDNSQPAIRMVDGTLTLRDCDISGDGTGDAIEQIDGLINAYRTTVHAGDVDLSTNACILNMYFCRLVTDPIDTAGNLVHQINLDHCDLNGQSIVSAATGATIITVDSCTFIDQITNAGTGAFTVRNSHIESVNLTSTGTMVAYGGYIGVVTRAAASFVWWLDGSTIKVLPSATITDGMIEYALAAATAAGRRVELRLAPGDYEEDNLALADDCVIVGAGHTTASGSHVTINSANPVFTAGAVQANLRHLRITQAGAGAAFVINNAAAVVHLDSVEFESTAGNAITMTAGTCNIHNSTSNDGDYNLSAAACTLTMYRSCVVSGNIVTAGAFAHVVTLESICMSGGNITNGATGVGSTTDIDIIKCFNIGTFTDASQIGTVLIEATIIAIATKTGTSPWTVRRADFALLSNENATGAITCNGGWIYAITRAIGPIIWLESNYTYKVIPCGTTTDTIIQWAINVAGAGDTIKLAAGTYNEPLVFNAAADVLTLVGESTDKVIITQAGGTTVTITDCGAVCFENLTLAGTAMDNDYVIYVNANASAASLTMRRVKISGARTGNSAYGIYTLGTNNVVLILDDIELVMTGTATTYGIYLICNGGTNTLDMYDSYVSAPTQDLNAADYCTVRCNHSTFPTGGIFAADDGLIRLRDCSFRAIFRTGTGNIVDESPVLKDAPWKVHRWTWQATLANSQVGARGAPVDGGSGQVHLPVTDGGAASRVAVEATAEVVGTLGTHFTPARTPRFITQISIDNWATAGTNFKMFYGLRETLGNSVPLAAEHHAGFEWDGTNFQAVNADGVKQTTNLTTPTNATQVQLEVIIIGGVQVEFYIDGVLVHTETSNVPTAVLDWQHLEEALGNATATTINGTVRTGGVQECPA